MNRQVRVGTGLVTFPVWAFASDGAKGSRVQVHFPAGYDVSVESGDFDSRTKGTDGGVTLSTQPLGEPLTYFSYLTAQREAVYKASPMTVDAGDRSIDLVVRGWRDDPAWAGRIGGLFRKALPQLTREIGLPWPETQATVVQEAVSRAAGGYAGLFAPAERRIEVAYWADPLVVLHEAAHGWFNGGLVADRWASEGFASLYAQRAAGKLKVRDTSPKLTAAIGKAAIPLNAWPNTAGDGGADLPTETYGYAASLALARAIAARAGDDALQRVWAAASARVGAYQPETAAAFGDAGDPETVDGPPDWRGLLDLLETETGKDFTDLWRKWVIRPEEAALLDARADARTAYARTLALAGDWRLPRGHPRRHALVAVRRGPAAAGRRADRARAARRDQHPGRSWRADLAAGRPAALPGGRHGRRLARGRGGAQRDPHGHAGRGRPGPRRRPAEPDRDARARTRRPRSRRPRPRSPRAISRAPSRRRTTPIAPGRRRGRRAGGAPCWSRPSSRARWCWSRRSRPGRGRRAASGPPPSSRAPDLVMRVTGVAAAFVGPAVAMKLRRPAIVGVLLAVLLTVLAAVGPPAAAPIAPFLAAIDAPVALAADDLGVTTKARYVVVPQNGVIRVAVDVAVVNQKPNRVSGGVITRYFYDSVNLGVQVEATHLRATQDGAPVRVTSAVRRGFRLVTISFRNDIYVGETAHVRLQFDLPAGAPRSDSDVRVGPAFATFLAWAFGDRGSVRIDIPKAFDVDISGEDMEASTTAISKVFTATTNDALGWFAWVNARNDDGLTRERLDLADGEQVVVRGWPEDSRWRRRVSVILSDSVPDLVGRIGLPWPVDGPLNVLEVHTPLLEGYAGFYDPKSDEITISENLDDLTIVHEASHAWFNSRLFTDRWINEGLAEEYASQVLAAETRGKVDPAPVKRSAKVAFPLAPGTRRRRSATRRATPASSTGTTPPGP